MSDGIGCQCYARCSSECGCENVDWTPREVIELRNQLSHLQKLCDHLQTENDSLYAYKTVRGSHLECEVERLAKLCEEHRVEIADRADTERSMAQAMLEDGEKIKELESQLAEKEKEIELLRRMTQNDIVQQLMVAQNQLAEKDKEIADRADTERSMTQAMLEDDEKIKELESQLAEKEKEKEKEIERLNRLLELTKNKWIEDTVKEGRVVLLQSQLATQTERIRELENKIEAMEYDAKEELPE